MLPSAVARRVGLEEREGADLEQRLVRVLADQQRLLVVDNCECRRRQICATGWPAVTQLVRRAHPLHQSNGGRHGTGSRRPSAGLTRRHGPYPLTRAVDYLQTAQARPVPEWFARREARRVRAISTADGIRKIGDLFDPTAEGEHTAADVILKLAALVIVALLDALAKVGIWRR